MTTVKKQRKKNRIPEILLAAVCLICVSALGLYMIYEHQLKGYFEASEPSMTVPGLSGGFIPQGLAYDGQSGRFLVSGYMDSWKQSPLYVMENEDLGKKVPILTEDSSVFRGHAGGVSVYKDTVYLAGSTKMCVYTFPVKELLEAEFGQPRKAEKCISLRTDGDYIRASFTSVDDKYLYIGEFHKGFIFYTHRSHKVEAEGTVQKAYLVGLTFDENGQTVPACVYSIPDRVQGACFSENHVFLSQSHGFLPAEILAYSLDDLRQSGSKEVLGKVVPLYILTEENAAKKTKIPPMSEEMVIVDGKIYIVFEAASNRYQIGKLLGLDRIWSTPVEYFL